MREDKNVSLRKSDSILKRKAESAGGRVYEFKTRTTASQVCHCGERHKKLLRQRVHDCMCGVIMQRDLYSAYLARFVKEDVLHATEASLSWLGALLRATWKHSQQLASGRKVLASFGVFWSQSESPEKENLVERKRLDVVACGREPIRAQSIIAPPGFRHGAIQTRRTINNNTPKI